MHEIALVFKFPLKTVKAFRNSELQITDFHCVTAIVTDYQKMRQNTRQFFGKKFSFILNYTQISIGILYKSKVSKSAVPLTILFARRLHSIAYLLTGDVITVKVQGSSLNKSQHRNLKNAFSVMAVFLKMKNLAFPP